MEPLTILTHITILLVLGITFSLISNKLKIPNILFLILIGFIIANINYNGKALMEFPPIFITSIGILALVMIVFDSCNRFKWNEFDSLTLSAGKLATATFIINLMVFSVIAYLIVPELNNIYYALIIAVIISATGPDIILSLYKKTKNKAVDVLKFESLINTPLTVVLPFLFIDLMRTLSTEGSIETSITHIGSFFQQIITGVGAGVVIGIIIFKFMKKYYSEKLSPMILITSCLLTYIVAENLQGSGILGVTVLGLFFGNLHIKEKSILSEFSGMFSNTLLLLVFILLGLLIKIPLTINFFLISLALYIISIGLRIIAVYLTFPGTKLINNKEKIFMSLNTPKGIAATVATFGLFSYISLNYSLDGEIALNLILVFIIYSIIVSSFITHFSKYFIKVEVSNE
jgi:NhaP-type Na+/H+ or K+/H+ antiporter